VHALRAYLPPPGAPVAAARVLVERGEQRVELGPPRRVA
jgi:hypothetical protein